jgi:hypothetical protein
VWSTRASATSPATSTSARRFQLSDGLRTLRVALRHHANAYFDLVELAALGDIPAALARPRAEIAAEVRGLLAAFLDRSTVMAEVDRTADPALDKVAFRPVAGHAVRPPGVDFLLPYWMARALGVLAG